MATLCTNISANFLNGRLIHLQFPNNRITEYGEGVFTVGGRGWVGRGGGGGELGMGGQRWRGEGWAKVEG